MTPRPVTAGLVSTVVTVYNRPALLADAVNSVLAQTYRPIEIVIVDDGSTDESGAVGRGFQDRFPDIVRYAYQSNQGPAAASNHGLRLITGEFVQFLDSDDVLMPQKFERQVDGLRAHPSCGISYCYAREYAIGSAWSGLPARRSGDTFDQLFPALLSGKIWPTPAPLYRREVVDANGEFLDVRIYQDWEYECRAAARGVRLHHCPEFLADLRGTHHLEGRKKGGASGTKLREWSHVLTRVLGHARDAGVAQADLDALSAQLFRAARKCAAGGYEAEARACLDRARDTASHSRRRRIEAYRAASDRFGWREVGRWSEDAAQSWIAGAIRTVRREPRVFASRWRHRWREAIKTTAGQPVDRWPRLLWHRWQHRRSKSRVLA